MKKLKISALLLGAALAALLAVGCGSSDDSISKAEFVKQANAICKTSNAENEKEFEELAKEEGLKGKPSKQFEEKAVESIVVPGVSGQLEEIRDLGFPDDEAEEIVESAEEDLEEAEGDPSAFFSGEPFQETNKKARAYGLTVCGSEG